MAKMIVNILIIKKYLGLIINGTHSVLEDSTVKIQNNIQYDKLDSSNNNYCKENFNKNSEQKQIQKEKYA